MKVRNVLSCRVGKGLWRSGCSQARCLFANDLISQFRSHSDRVFFAVRGRHARASLILLVLARHNHKYNMSR